LILADTSGLIALLDRSDSRHEDVKPYYRNLIVPTTVLAEFDYLATRRVGSAAVREFYRGIEKGSVRHAALEEADIKRAFEIADLYADARVGLTDASLVALAERYRVPRILTLDRRHFSMFRPKGLGHLELLP
jgi:predicted nucleic acid-binding protein